MQRNEMARPYETDENGNVITKPVTGYDIGPVYKICVFLAVQYVDKPEELEAGPSKQIQFVLTPSQCLDLAAALKRNADRLMADMLPAGQSPN